MEKYLRKCLDSLIFEDEELFNALEVLVINDGSKDSSSAIAHEYQNKYPAVFRVIDKENGHYGSCVNTGLSEAVGKYIKILDADDSFDNRVLRRYINYLSIVNVDMILTDYNVVNDNYTIVRKVSFKFPENQNFPIEKLCVDKKSANLHMHAVTYLTKKLKDNKYTQTCGVAYTDEEWMNLPVTYMSNFCYYKETLYQYLVGREGQSISPEFVATQTQVKFFLIYKRIAIYNNAIIRGEIEKEKLIYLKNRLINGAAASYKRAIIHKQISPTDIVDFDKNLERLSKDIYDNVTISSYGRYRGLHFIKAWRKKYRLPFLLNLLIFIVKHIK